MFLLEREYTRAFRLGSEFSLIAFCIKLLADDKNVMPPAALSALMDAINKTKREVDVIGLFGPKTFGIILPNANSVQSCQFVDRVVGDLPKLAPDLGQYRPVLYCGIATVPHDARELAGLVQSAQRAMIEAAKTNVIRVRVCDISS